MWTAFSVMFSDTESNVRGVCCRDVVGVGSDYVLVHQLHI